MKINGILISNIHDLIIADPILMGVKNFLCLFTIGLADRRKMSWRTKLSGRPRGLLPWIP